ncbi:ATP-binding cassette domain-containing protein [Streptomyces sp. NPDC027717]|uniref:ATP-binding cassette domain-containing protein n=1 Tax=Streptomyces sp. NPDC027717 TaxID=3155765 RepID=UPI0033C3A638
MSLRYDTCTYTYGRGKRPVLDGFTYEVQPGLTVLLGPNGAGKSTLLRLGASVTTPRSGSVNLGRLKAGSREYRRAVAWMPQNIAAVPSLTAREYVAYVGWLKGMSRSEAWEAARGALRQVELADKENERTSNVSGGQLRRIGVAGALVHGARVLLLDEPTAGMDPRQRRVFRDLLRGLSGDVAVLLSTHDVADLAEEADQVAVLESGRLLHSGTTASFLAHCPPGVPDGRMAEGAYSAVLDGSPGSLI